MADSYDGPYSSPHAGPHGPKQEPPPRDRIVMPKRFDPLERLEVNTRKVEKRKEVAAQVELIREEIRRKSMPFSSSMPTVIGDNEKPVRRCKCFKQQQQRLDAIRLTPTRFAEAPLPPIEENQNRIVMPTRLNPRLKLEMKQKMEKQALEEMTTQNQVPSTSYPVGYSPEHTYENIPQNPLAEKMKPSLAPKKPPRQRRPGQGSVMDSTLARQTNPVNTEVPRNTFSSLSVGSPASSDETYPSSKLKAASRGRVQLQVMPPTKDPVPTHWDPFCLSPRVVGLDSNNYRDYLADKGAALVMFYQPLKSACIRGKDNFVKAAESTNRENAAFAAVDCSLQESLCFNEGITKLPTYKLYSQGQLVNIVKDSIFFGDSAMKKFVEKAPGFTQEGLSKPSCKFSKSLLKKAIQKITSHT